MKKLSNTLFEKIIADYKAKPDVDTMAVLFEVFETLASNIVKYFIDGKLGKIFKKKETVRDLVCLSFLKMHRYDPDKGRAFNFFTTIMLGWLRQVYRSKKNYAELKAAYAKKVRNN
jgi:hypothetical protein